MSPSKVGRIVIGRLYSGPGVAVSGVIIGIIGREKTIIAVDGINGHPVPGRPFFRLFFWTI
jgi:hypothetical protein